MMRDYLLLHTGSQMVHTHQFSLKILRSTHENVAPLKSKFQGFNYFLKGMCCRDSYLCCWPMSSYCSWSYMIEYRATSTTGWIFPSVTYGCDTIAIAIRLHIGKWSCCNASCWCGSHFQPTPALSPLTAFAFRLSVRFWKSKLGWIWITRKSTSDLSQIVRKEGES